MGKPDGAAFFWTGLGKFDHEIDAAGESGVETRLAVAGEQDDAVVVFDPLQQVIGLRVGEAVVRVGDIGAFAEEGIGFVEEEDDLGLLRAGEKLRQIFFCLADVLARNGSEIDPIKWQAELGRNPTRGERFASAARPGKESPHSGPITSRR